MAGEYDINLSNGTILATLYPLEVSGPDNVSTPRFIEDIDTTANTFTINSDLTGRFVAGFQFTVQNSAGGLNDGTYTVAPGGSTLVGDQTVIPVTTPIASSALPLGEIRYTVLDPRTTLSLPGRGTIHYGEYLVDNFVHLLENFAADVPPDMNPNIGSSPAGESLLGQWWYNTTPGEEGFKYYDGTDWTSNYDLDNGVLIFRDPQNTVVPNTDMFITADETSLTTYGWTAAAEPGMVVWTKDNPNSGEALFRVMSQNGSQCLRVEHGGVLSTSNTLEILAQTGTNESFIDGTLAIGGKIGSPNRATTTQTLTVQGDGIAVNSDLATNASLRLNSPPGMVSFVDFLINNTLQGNIAVNDTVAGDPLELNSISANNVAIATGGGNVGINQINPSRKLDVVGDSEFNGDVYVVNSDVLFNDGFGLESSSGALLKTGAGGQTWQFWPGSNLSSGIVVNDSLNDVVFKIGETAGTEVLKYNFVVNTDTLYVNATTNRVGVNTTPSYSLDVVGNSRIVGRVGINQTPPVTNNPIGTDIWLSTQGDTFTSGQFVGNDGSSAAPTYSFANHTNTGMFWSSGGIEITAGTATATVRLDSTNFLSNVPMLSTGYEFLDPGTSIDNPGPGEIDFNSGGSTRLKIEADGTLSVAGTANYETLVTSDGDIPNKKYVDDSILVSSSLNSWRDPVVARDQILRADSSTFPTTGTIDGVILNVGDRVLFSSVTAVADRDIWIWDGATWTQDTTNARSVGDVVYVQQGTDFGKVYAFDKDNGWTLISTNADTLDGLDSTQFIRSDVADTKTSGTLTFDTNVSLSFGTSNEFVHSYDGANYLWDSYNATSGIHIRDANNAFAIQYNFDIPTGDFTAAGNVTAYSDIRVKTNIERIPNALDKVKRLNGYTFDRTDIDSPRQIGLIAQELLDAVPEAVVGGPTEENPDERYSVAYGNLVGLLIEAIKEQQLEIDDLRKKLGS